MARPQLNPRREVRLDMRMTKDDSELLDIISSECEMSKTDVMIKGLHVLFTRFPPADQQIMLEKLSERMQK